MYQYNPLLIESTINNVDKEKKKENIKSGLTGSMIGNFAPAIAASPLLLKYKSQTVKGDNKLPESIKNLKVNGKQNVSDYLKEKGINFANSGHKAGANFDPSTNTIHLPIKDNHMDTYGKSLFAHELGHSVKMQMNDKGKINKQAVGKVASYGISKNLTTGAAFFQIINCFRNDDESRQKVGRALSIAGGVSALPMIAEEIGASMRGTKMLGLKGKDKARAFIGVGSYITLALSPTIMYQVSERTRRFLRSLKQIKNENPQVQQNLNNLKNQDTKVKI